MNKFQTLSWLGATGLLLSLASCSNDEMPVPSGDKLTFTVSLPADVATRAFGDGLEATNLNVAIYEAGKTETAPLISTFPGGANSRLVTIESLGNNKFTVTVPLARSAEYDVVFWAQSYGNDDENTPFTYNAETQTISVNYDKMTINSELSDAFYAKESGVVAGIAQEKDVILYRPFAQVNVGAADYQEYINAGGKGITQSSLTFTALPTTFSLAEGTAIATEDDADVTFNLTDIPVGENFPIENNANVKYLAMAYVLAGSATSPEGVTDVTLNVTNGTSPLTREYTSIPVQTNYRTNIYGRILTNINDFNVTINPIYDGVVDWDPSAPSEWDGKTITPIEDIERDDEGNYLLKSASDLAALSKFTTTPDSKFILMADVDYKGQKFTAAGTSAKRFKGEFDGNGHKIMGIGATNGKTANSIFSIVENLYVHDLNLTVNTSSSSPLIQQAYGTVRVENVTVNAAANNTITAYQGSYYGSIIGIAQTGSTVVINRCENNADIKGSTISTAGGIMGTGSGQNISISNSTNNGNITSAATGTNSQIGVAGIIGSISTGKANISNCINTGDINYTASRGYAAGILGSTGSGTSGEDITISKCRNSGNITMLSNQQSNGQSTQKLAVVVAAGIYGGTTTGSYTSKAIKTITGCTNTGNISSTSLSLGNAGSTNEIKAMPQYAGVYSAGIVGFVRYCGLAATGNTNSGNIYVASAEATTYMTPFSAAAGIVNTIGVCSINLSDNTCTSAATITGNDNPLVGAIYTWDNVAKDTKLPQTFPSDAVVEGNVNSTSYPVSNR